MDGPVHDAMRRMAGSTARLLPQARYGRMIVVLSHMRGATTALSHVLCAHPAVSGYGETHVAHDGASAPGRVLVNLARRGAFDPRAPRLLDKILHDRLDAAPPASFYAARAVFLLRAPGPAVASILRLGARTGLAEGASAETAARYYAARVERLATHWDRFAPGRRCGLSTAALLADPDAALAALGPVLGLRPPLVNRYAAHPAARAEGAGDPTRSAGLARIAAGTEPEMPLDGVGPALAARCAAAHAALAARFAAG